MTTVIDKSDVVVTGWDEPLPDNHPPTVAALVAGVALLMVLTLCVVGLSFLATVLR